MRTRKEAFEEYNRWLTECIDNQYIHDELLSMSASEIEDAFCDDLSFGTGGMRGIIGAGTDRMNEYTVARISRGIADYIGSRSERASIVIAYDSRDKSAHHGK